MVMPNHEAAPVKNRYQSFSKHWGSAIFLMLPLFIFWVIFLTVIFASLDIIGKGEVFVVPLTLIIMVVHSFFVSRNIIINHQFYNDRVVVSHAFRPSKDFTINYNDILRIDWQINWRSNRGSRMAFDYNLIIVLGNDLQLPVHRPWLIRAMGVTKMPKGVPAELCPLLDGYDMVKFIETFGDVLKITTNGIDEDDIYSIRRKMKGDIKF